MSLIRLTAWRIWSCARRYVWKHEVFVSVSCDRNAYPNLVEDLLVVMADRHALGDVRWQLPVRKSRVVHLERLEEVTEGRAALRIRIQSEVSSVLIGVLHKVLARHALDEVTDHRDARVGVLQ